MGVMVTGLPTINLPFLILTLRNGKLLTLTLGINFFSNKLKLKILMKILLNL